MSRHVAVLLATCNGEKYIRELLNSILLSRYIDSLSLYIRDDGSSDSTLEILKQYELQYKSVIKLYAGENIGTSQGFSFLLKESLASGHSYFMFADQDDKWIDNKIEKILEKLRSNDFGKPKLVHSNLYVVNEKLEMISDSFWRYQNLNPNCDGFNRLLIQNVITGCTIGMNRRLAEMLYPIPKEAIMHDWWAGLIASAFGVIEAIPEPLVYYRQHNANTIGAQKYSLSFDKVKEELVLSKYVRQAETFCTRYYDELDEDKKRILRQFISLSSVNRLRAVWIVFANSFYKNGPIRNIGFILKILLQKQI